MSNRLPVLASAPTDAIAGADTSTDSGQERESSDFALVSAPACARAEPGLALLPDPLWDFEFVDFLAASLAALAALSICSFALFKVEDSPRVSLHKLHKLSRQLFVKFFGSACQTQRCTERTVIVTLIGLKWFWDDVDTNLFVAHTRQGEKQYSLREQRHQFL